MTFKDVIGHKELCMQLERLACNGCVPHAILFTGVAGCGKLALALALAQALLSDVGPEEAKANSKQSADLADRYIHPDMHFVFPVKRRKSGVTLSDMYIDEWRRQLNETVYFDFADWMTAMDCDREQPMIYEAESGEILRKLSMKSAMGGRKVLLVVWPERMNDVCANKLLKIIEEPPAGTHILMVTDDADRLLPTVLSRTQIVRVPPIADYDIAVMLAQRYGFEEQQALSAAHLAQGSVTRALRRMNTEDDERQYFDVFVQLMRRAYMRDVKTLRDWANQLADKGREQQKAFLQYAGRFVRENFVFNFHESSLNYLSREEIDFARKFSRFINERNVISIMQEIEKAERDIIQNVNSKMVFFDLALQIIVLLIRK